MKKHVVFALIASFVLASAAAAAPRAIVKTQSGVKDAARTAGQRMPMPTTIHGTIFFGSDYNGPSCNCDAFSVSVARQTGVTQGQLAMPIMEDVVSTKAKGGTVAPGRSCEYSVSVPADKLNSLSVDLISVSMYLSEPLDLRNPFSMIAGGSVRYNIRVHNLIQAPK